MSESSEIAYLKPFIESTIDAAARFRRVLIVMTIASILAFGALWNSLDETWFNSRIAAARGGEAYLTLKDIFYRLTQIEKDVSDLTVKAQEEKEEKNKRELEEKVRGLNTDKDALLRDSTKILKERFDKDIPLTGARTLGEALQSKDFQIVERWIKQRMIPNKEQAGQYAQKLEDARTGNILLIHIPFSGNVFDVNTLGLWGGITFTVILLMFRFSLWREYNNLKLAFNEAKPEHLRYCYLALAMQQVLTVPPALAQNQPHLKPQGKVIQLLYLPPFLIQLAIIVNDVRTESIGEIFSSYLALISIGLSGLLLMAIVRLTLRCLKLSFAIDKEWETAAEKVHIALLSKWSIHQ